MSTHLIAHGFLHLVGFDHEEEAQAVKMEALEREILAALGIRDPYAALRYGHRMSVNDDPESTPEKPGKVGLLGKLRSLLGLGGGSLREDVQEAIEEITEASGFSALEREMLTNVLSLHEVRVADIMIPRADIIAVAHRRAPRRSARCLPHRRPFAPAGLR